MFREMRRKEKLMPMEAARRILTEAEYGTLATMGQDGYPYAIPLNFVCCENVIYFHTATTGHKLDNIDFIPRVCFSVVGYHKLLAEKFDTEYDSVVVFGSAGRVIEAAERRQALLLLVEKYSSAWRDQGIEYIDGGSCGATLYKIDIQHVTGKIGR